MILPLNRFLRINCLASSSDPYSMFAVDLLMLGHWFSVLLGYGVCGRKHSSLASPLHSLTNFFTSAALWHPALSQNMTNLPFFLRRTFRNLITGCL